MAVRGYEEEAMRPKSRAAEPNAEYCKPISNVATPSFNMVSMAEKGGATL